MSHPSDPHPRKPAPAQIAIHTIHKGCPPIVFVGTRKDIVSSPVVHGEISAALDKAFSSHPVWPFVHHDVHGKTGTSGTTTTRLTFFAVNNVKGRGDPVVLRLLNVMQVYAFTKKLSSFPRHTSSLLSSPLLSSPPPPSPPPCV